MKGKNYAVFYFTGKRIFFYIYDVITSPEKEKSSANHYFRRAYILRMQVTCTHTCSYMYVCTGVHHITRPEGITRAYHKTYTVELARGPVAPPENPVRDQDQSAFSQVDFSVEEGCKEISPSKNSRPPPPTQTLSNENVKISPSKITRTAPQPPAQTLSNESEKTVEEGKLRHLLESSRLSSQEFDALLRAISSLAPDLESPTTAPEATTFVLQVAGCMSVSLVWVPVKHVCLCARARSRPCLCNLLLVSYSIVLHHTCSGEKGDRGEGSVCPHVWK